MAAAVCICIMGTAQNVSAAETEKEAVNVIKLSFYEKTLAYFGKNGREFFG